MEEEKQQNFSQKQEKFVVLTLAVKQCDYENSLKKFEDIPQQLPIYNHSVQKNVDYQTLLNKGLQIQQIISQNNENEDQENQQNKKKSQDIEDLDFEEIDNNKEEENDYFSDQKFEEINNDDDDFEIQSLNIEEIEKKEEIQSKEQKDWKYWKQRQIKKNQRLKNYCSKWFQMPKYGNILEGTNIIPGKTPLLTKWWKKIFESEKEQLYFGDMLDELKANGTPIKLIIDLTEENKYYTFHKLKKYYLKEQLQDVTYAHHPISIYNPPRKSDLNKIYDLLNKNAHKKDFYIFIHCFCGINRTGYILSYFLCRKLNLKSSEGIKKFEASRGITFERQNLVEDLQEKFDYL